jgi:membrane-associated phospholipid phosphatase
MCEEEGATVQDLREHLSSRKYLIVHLVVGLLAIAVGLIVFGSLAWKVVNDRSIVQLDQDVATALHAWATPATTNVYIVISTLGYQVLWAVVIIVAIYLARQRQWIHLITWVVGWAGGEALNQLLKLYFARPRPFFTDPLLTPANYSFPSGHAMISAIMYGLLAYFILLEVKNPAGRIAIIVGTVILVLLIGFSRIYLGVHFVSDVIAGFAAGSIWLTVCISGMELARSRHPIRPQQPSPT